jgi:preprotein translocase SecE subunit
MSTDRPRPGESDADLGADSVRDDELGAERVGDDELGAERVGDDGFIDDNVGDDGLGDDRVRDDDYERDFGDAEPPDPLGQAMPDITEAHIAEAGPDGPTRRRPSRAERAERARRQEAAGRAGNEAQIAAMAANGESDSHEVEPVHHSNEPAHPRKGIFGRAADFLRASYAELRRVQWPDRRQVGQGTAVTLGFVVVAGAYLGLLDAIWNPIIQAIL